MLNDRHWSSLITWAKNQGWPGTPTRWSERDAIAEEIIEHVADRQKRGIGVYTSAIDEIRDWITADILEAERIERERIEHMRRISTASWSGSTSTTTSSYGYYYRHDPWEYHNGYRM